MSNISGFHSFVYPFNVNNAVTDASTPFPIVVSKGTYIITINCSILCSALPLGVVVSLSTQDIGIPEAIPTVILRNTATPTNGSFSLPSGANTTQVVNLSGIYTFPADTTCYLRVGTNGVFGVDTYTLVSSGNVNVISFTQIA